MVHIYTYWKGSKPSVNFCTFFLSVYSVCMYVLKPTCHILPVQLYFLIPDFSGNILFGLFENTLWFEKPFSCALASGTNSLSFLRYRAICTLNRSCRLISLFQCFWLACIWKSNGDWCVFHSKCFHFELLFCYYIFFSPSFCINNYNFCSIPGINGNHLHRGEICTCSTVFNVIKGNFFAAKMTEESCF